MAEKKTQTKTAPKKPVRPAGGATKKVVAKKAATKVPAKKATNPKATKVARAGKVAVAKGMTAPVYTMDGKENGTVTLPESVFAAKWNADMVHQVVEGMKGNARVPYAHTKDRSEVRGGGRKPWRQKGTGRARHGSRRSPIWVGGGVTHGPRKERVFTKKINKKMRARALASVLSRKLHDNEVVFVDMITFATPKAIDAKNMLANVAKGVSAADLATKKKNAVLIALGSDDKNVKKSFKNFDNVEVEEVRNLNPIDLLTYKYVILTQPDESVLFLASRIK